MSIVAFTEKFVVSALPGEYSDSVTKGLTLRVKGAARKFYARYSHDKKQRRILLGVFPMLSLANARKKMKALLGEVVADKDPFSDRRKNALTFCELTEKYLILHAPRKAPRSQAEDDRQINTKLVPAWGKKNASSITRRDIIDLLNSMQDTPASAINLRALISKLFNFALDQDLLQTSPFLRIPKPDLPLARDRVLTTDEIRAVMQSSNYFLQLVLLTGQRPGEIAGMSWGEIEGEIWSLPSARSKNKLAHKVLLTPTTLGILAQCKERNFLSYELDKIESYKHFVFPNPRGGSKRWWRSPDNATWTPHDLRRTMSTFLENEGVASDTIDAMQNHKKQGIKRVYQHGDRWRQCADAWRVWEKLLLEIKNGNDNN